MNGYKPQSLDTSEEAERLQFDIWRQMPVWERFQRVGELCEAVDQLAEVGIRHRYPDASEHEVRMRLFAARLDRDTMIKAYSWDPLEH